MSRPHVFQASIRFVDVSSGRGSGASCFQDGAPYNAEPMKPAGIIGIVLIVIGIIALAYGGFTYTKREKVLDLGPIQATAEKQKTIPFPPVLGGICLVGGIVLVIAGSRRS